MLPDAGLPLSLGNFDGGVRLAIGSKIFGRTILGVLRRPSSRPHVPSALAANDANQNAMEPSGRMGLGPKLGRCFNRHDENFLNEIFRFDRIAGY